LMKLLKEHFEETESKITNPFLCKCHGYLIQGNDV